jgi:phage/plasmid-associated DNA primase
MDLYQAYKQWAADSGEFEMNMTNFGRKLTERGVFAEKRGRTKYRVGIKLLPGTVPTESPEDAVASIGRG